MKKTRSLIMFLPVLTFLSILFVYFTGDDFFHFTLSQTSGSLKEILSFFKVQSFEARGVAFYRPLTREVLYNVFYQTFGLNHIPFRILALVLHATNIFLVYKLIKSLFSKKIARFAAFFFGVSAAQVGVLYYLAGGIQAQGATLFTLLSMLSFSVFLTKQTKKHYIFTLLFYSLSLTCHEMAVLTPFILLSLLIYRKNVNRQSLKTYFLLLVPFFALLSVYLYTNLFLIGFSVSESQYQLSLNPKTALNTLMWYALWGFGLPETLVDLYALALV